MVKKGMFLTLLAAFMTTAVCMADAPSDSRRDNSRRPRRPITPPVYAPSAEKQQQAISPEKMSPEARAKFDSARRRRFEIMVLINACKIMPEAEQAPLKAELLKRIDADFQAMMADQKARIAQAEQELQQLRKELDEREKNREVFEFAK